jgi:hypothetical protein
MKFMLILNHLHTFFVVYQAIYMKSDLSLIKVRLTGTTDRLYGLVVRVSGYRSRNPGSIPATTRFSEK